MKKNTLANKCLSLSLALFMAMSSMVMVGCGSPVEIVQQAVGVFQTSKGIVASAQALLPELQQLNPELAKEVAEYAGLANANLDNLIAAGNAYIAKPSGDKYQNILNAVDALTASVDAKVLAAAKITNPQAQHRVLAILTLASVSSHAILTLLQQRASKAQVKAMPVIAARADFEKVKQLIDQGYVRSEITKAGYNADVVMAAAGL
ncbi:MAG TPA: hypothetical protein VGQ12_16980 [Candidatus Angelobacter sp.]|nr:hypothetical protein [Candidatus Angelobacter sp.]